METLTDIWFLATHHDFDYVMFSATGTCVVQVPHLRQVTNHQVEIFLTSFSKTISLRDWDERGKGERTRWTELADGALEQGGAGVTGSSDEWQVTQGDSGGGSREKQEMCECESRGDREDRMMGWRTMAGRRAQGKNDMWKLQDISLISCQLHRLFSFLSIFSSPT